MLPFLSKNPKFYIPFIVHVINISHSFINIIYENEGTNLLYYMSISLLYVFCLLTLFKVVLCITLCTNHLIVLYVSSKCSKPKPT